MMWKCWWFRPDWKASQQDHWPWESSRTGHTGSEHGKCEAKGVAWTLRFVD
jgi:hypothetical protein